jgi:hypothetical protein
MGQGAIAQGTIDGSGSNGRNDRSRRNGRINVWPKQRLWMNGSSDGSRNNRRSDESESNLSAMDKGAKKLKERWREQALIQGAIETAIVML